MTVLETLPIGVWILNQRGRIIYGNPAGKRIWAGVRSMTSDKGWWLSTGQPIGPGEWASARAIQRGETSIDEQIIIEGADGMRKVILNSAIPLSIGRRRRGAIVVNQDVTARINAEASLAERESQWRNLFDILPVGAAILDEHRALVETNPALDRILRIPSGSIPVGYSTQRRFIHPDGTPLQPEDFPSNRAIREQRVVEDVEIGIIPEDGEPIWTNVSAAPLSTSAMRAIVITADITARKRVEAALRQANLEIAEINRQLEAALRRERDLARTDSLTGIANRRKLADLADHAIAIAKRYDQPLTAILFDLDHFKRVNDTWGHSVGDRTLQHVAHICLSVLRETELFARYGGEEFLVLLPQSDAAETLIVAERLRQAIADQPLSVPQGTIAITISLGIATLAAHDDLQTLVQRADQALYRAKAAGRNCAMIFESANLDLPVDTSED